MHISIDQAATLLLMGHVVAVPTETVYGLAASLYDPNAIAQIFTVKGRPSNNPLIIHLASAEQLNDYVHTLPPYTEKLTAAFWPGPMTLVLPIISEKISTSVRAGLPTAAFRVPHFPITHELIKKTGPLVMPSANLSGKPSATSATHVETDFGADFPVVDGGDCINGVESTILYWNEHQWVIIRLGAIAPEVFKPILGYIPNVVGAESSSQPICPGQLYRHYAPRATLILTPDMPIYVDTIIGFDDRVYPHGKRLLSMGLSSDPFIATHRLYAILRQLDEEGILHAWIDIDIPDTGLWLTFKERIYKAAQAK